MTCQGCEARRKWMKEQYERSKERMRMLLLYLVRVVCRTQSSTASTIFFGRWIMFPASDQCEQLKAYPH